MHKYVFDLKEEIPYAIKIPIFQLELWYRTLFAPLVDSNCPICGHKKAKLFCYGPDNSVSCSSRQYPEVSVGHNKYRCMNCFNIYATWLQRDLAEVGEIYSGIDNGTTEVHVENERKEVQKEMIRACAALIRDKQVNDATLKILDFGCGPNYRAAIEMNKEDHDLDCFCCDINPSLPYNGISFFKYTGTINNELEGAFDGITSVDVFEHLNQPIDDMLKFNRILKKSGCMVYFAPLQWYLRLHPGHYDTAFHTNFPSKKSLQMLCRKTGFQLIGDYMPRYGFWYLAFRKISDVQIEAPVRM